MENKLLDLFITVLELPENIDSCDIRRDKLDQWSSLKQIALISQIEAAYDIVFDAQDYSAITSYEAALALLRNRGV